jgi:integrase
LQRLLRNPDWNVLQWEDGVQTRFEFTRARLDKLPRPASGWKYYYDARVPPLAIGIGSTGLRTFYVVKRVGGKVERIKLDRVDNLSIDAARNAAGKVLAKLAAGENVAEGRRAARAGIALRELFEDFIEHRRSRRGGFLSEKTKRDHRCDFRNHLATLADKPATSITREQLAVLHTRIGRKHPVRANRVVALMSALYSHADDRRLCNGHNPARGIRKFPEQARERFLQAEELAPFVKALAKTPEPWRWIFALALFTGARRGNILSARWQDFDLAARLWRIPQTKRGTPVTVPLSDAALAVLERTPRIDNPRGFLFPAHGDSGHLAEPKKAWADLVSRAGLTDIKIHDLRRTFGSWQAMAGSSLPIIGKSLGHSTTQATQVYARLTTQPVAKSVEKATADMIAAAKKGNTAAIRALLGRTKS